MGRVHHRDQRGRSATKLGWSVGRLARCVARWLKWQFDELVLFQHLGYELTNPLELWETNFIDVKFHRFDGSFLSFLRKELEVAVQLAQFLQQVIKSESLALAVKQLFNLTSDLHLAIQLDRVLVHFVAFDI